MLSQIDDRKIFKHRLLIFTITTLLFIAAFILNILINKSLFNVNLNQVPIWQKDSFWGSEGFIVFMNIVSNIFNPVICAGYVLLFFLISYRKLQILVFLIWFIFLSWILSIFKLSFHQARPYWISLSGIQMLEWTCYTEYGMPSGHAMMAIVLMQFMVRFFARVNKFVKKYIMLFYFLILFFQICVMFSRVILGMHSLNQVLFGCLIGCYSLVPYYLFVQHFILSWILKIFQKKKFALTIIILLCTSLVSLCISTIIVLLVNYENSPFTVVIKQIQKCQGYKPYKSFQYRCLQDSALLLAAIGILLAFNLMRNPSHLNLQLNYTRKSLRFLGKTLVTLIIPLLVLLIFINPLWEDFQTYDIQNKALLMWILQLFGFFFATFTLIYIIPLINLKFGFQVYKYPQSYVQFKKYQIFLHIKEEKKLTISEEDTETLKVFRNSNQKQLSLILES